MKLIFVFVLSLFFNVVNAQIYEANNAHAEVRGDAPVGDYTGVSNELTGNLNIEKGEVSFKLPLKSLKTGNDKRDGHMYETLDTDSYPYAEFNGIILSHFNIMNSDPQTVKIKGIFSIHGHQKEIETSATLDPDGNSIYFNSSFDLYITQYGMERPSVAFFKTDDKHTISVRGTLKKTETSAQN